MDAESEEIINSTNDTGQDPVNTDEVEETSVQEETEDSPQYTEHEIKMFERAKKAEAEAKQLKAELLAVKKKPQTVEKQTGEVSLKDQYALLSAQVPADDIDDVLEYAKFKSITVSEALKSTVVKATLSEKAEQRKSSEAANTAGSRRTTVKVTDDMLIDKSMKGEDVDPEALAVARMNQKKAKRA